MNTSSEYFIYQNYSVTKVVKFNTSEIWDVIMTARVFSILFSSLSEVESKYLNFEFRLRGGYDIFCPWGVEANFLVDGVFWRRAVISRNSTILKRFQLLHVAIVANRRVFHYVTVKQYNLGLLQYIKTVKIFN